MLTALRDKDSYYLWNKIQLLNLQESDRDKKREKELEGGGEHRDRS